MPAAAFALHAGLLCVQERSTGKRARHGGVQVSISWILSALVIALKNAGNIFLQLLPYILVGVILGEVLKLTSWTKLLYKWMNRRLISSVVAAVALGVISPLCTYGTIPVVLALYQGGVSLVPLFSFLVASSLMNPQLFIMTIGGLGLRFALLRLAVAIFLGLLAGVSMMLIPERFVIQEKIRLQKKSPEEILARPKKQTDFKIFLKNCLSNLLFVGKFMVLGILIGAVIETFIPKGYLLSLFGGSDIGSILVAALAGVPLYACGGGVIPVVKSLMSGGMSTGAAMAFMTVGQATRISPLMALASFMKVLFIVCYCVFLIAFSVLIGLLL